MSEQPTERPKPRAGCILLGLPIALTVCIASMYLVLFGLGSIGGTAIGERVSWSVTTCAEAKPILEQRIEAIGLGDPVWTSTGAGWSLTATLPGRDPKADQRIPSVLSRYGQLGVFAGSEPNADQKIVGLDDVVKSTFTLRELANPVIEVRLTNAGLKALRTHMANNTDGRISVWLDDEKILERHNTPIIEGTLLELRNHDEDGKQVLQITAEWSIILGHGPLPCPTTIQ